MKTLIINADDFGYCSQRNRGIIECINKHSVSSVSVLVNGIALKETELLLTMPDPPSIGLHFNITEGRPICLANSIPSLLNENGLFKGKFGLRDAAKRNYINMEEVAKELRSQMQSFKQLTGRLPSHVDGHHHIHVLPGICEVFASVLEENGVTWTRLPSELDIENCSWIEEERKSFYKEVALMARSAARAFSSKNIRFPHGFIGMRFMGKDMEVKKLSEAVCNVYEMCQLSDPVASTLCEFMVHPGYKSKSGEGGCGDILDEFSTSEEREHEMHVLHSNEWKQFLINQNIAVVPYPS